MEPEILVFMPNGDVTLTLTRSLSQEIDSPSLTRSSSFSSTSSSQSRRSSTVGKEGASVDELALAELENLTAVDADEKEEEQDESSFFFAPDPPTGEDSPLFPPPPRARRGSNASSRRERSSSPPASFWASLKRQQMALAPSVEEIPKPVVLERRERANKPKRVVEVRQEVRCVVSSRHMMLASEHFHTLLSGPTEEAAILKSTGHVTIPISVDPDTLIILLNIIHGKTREVPRQVSLDLLRKLAVMVSGFKILGSVEFFADTWIENSKGELPAGYTGEVLSWLFVFFVFERAEEFRDMTRITQRECDEKFDEDARELLLPVGLIDAMKQARQSAIETIVNVIHSLITKYMDGQTHCDTGMDEDLRFACDAMLLGSLMKGSSKIGIWPRPEAPFFGKKFNDLAAEIRKIKMVDVCGRSSGRRWSSYGGFERNCHGLEDQIESSIKAVEEGLGGLKLEDYRKEGVGSWEDFRAHIAPVLEKEIPIETIEAPLELVEPVKNDPEFQPEEKPILKSNVYIEPPTKRRESDTPQGIMARPRPSITEQDATPRELFPSPSKPMALPEIKAQRSPKDDLRKSYVLQGNKARLLAEDTPLKLSTKEAEVEEPVKKGFFAEVKDSVLPEMVQQSPTKERFPHNVNPHSARDARPTPSPTPSKEKIVYASIHEPTKSEQHEQKISNKKSVHQLAKREPTPPTDGFDFGIKRSSSHLQKEEIARELRELQAQQQQQQSLSSPRANATPSPPLVVKPSTAYNTKEPVKSSVKENNQSAARESVGGINGINLRPQNKSDNVVDLKDIVGTTGTTTEEESDVWIPPVSGNGLGGKGRKSKKRFAVNRF